MQLSLAMVVGALPCLVATSQTTAPMNWSQDGRWVAYTVSSPAEPPRRAPGWLFEGLDRREVASTDAPRAYRIYAGDAESGSAVLLEESRNPLTSPSWSPDGRALAFGRHKQDGTGERWEVVVQDAPGRDRVVASLPVANRPPGSFSGCTSDAPAWSPDGLYLAFALPGAPQTVHVLQSDNGRVLKSIEGQRPSWSPDGSKLAMIRADKTASLLVIEVSPKRLDAPASGTDAGLDFSAPRHLTDLGQTFQTPTWSRDGRSLLAVGRRVIVRVSGPTPQIDLLRIRVETGAVETVARLSTDQVENETLFRGVALTHDRDVDELFSAVKVDTQPETIVWTRPKRPETVDRLNPLHYSVRVGGLAFSPNGKTLAVRFGDAAESPTVALYDVWGRRLTLLAPDGPTRSEWSSLLIATADRLIRAITPPVVVGGRTLVRPTILPVPGELASNQEAVNKLQKFGRLGRPLCEGADAAGPSDLEARLYFDALREDYTAALSSLDALEARTVRPDERLRLLALRAQIFLGLGESDKAGDTIAFLRTIEDTATSRIEMTPAGVTLTPDEKESVGWSQYLMTRRDELARPEARKASNDEGPGIPMNPAGFPPNLPIERLPNGVFVVPGDVRLPRQVEPVDPGFRRPGAPRPRRLPNRVPPARLIPPAPIAPR